MRRRLRILAVLAAIVLEATACRGGSPSASEGSRVVTLVTHDSFDVSRKVLREFEEQTRIRVKILASGDAGQVVNRAILTAGNPEGDVLFGIDSNLLAQALDRNVFAPYAPERLDHVPDEFELDPEHRVTPIDHGEVCINFDKAWFAEHGVPVPRSLEELSAPAYRGLLVVENPATSTPGLAFLLATIARFGEDGWERYWERLRGNDVLVEDGWERAYFNDFSGAGGGHGNRPLVVSYASSPPAEVVFSEEPTQDAPTGVIEDTCYRQIEFAGVLTGAEHQEEAQALIDFMLSREFQEDIPLRMFVFPVVDDAALPDVFVKYAVVPMDPLSLPADMVAAERARWVDRWTELVLR